MASWSEFAEQDPTFAALGKSRLAGRVSYLATIRPDGGPRVHPVTPIIGEQLFLFMEPTSPKGQDLQRDGRFTLHCGVEDSNGGEGEFYVRGRAMLVTDSSVRTQAVQAASYTPRERYLLFVLSVEFAFFNRYTEDGPQSQRWEVLK